MRPIALSLVVLAWAYSSASAEEDAPSLSTLPPVELLAQQQPAEAIPRPDGAGPNALTLAEVEQLALSFNPTLAEAAARVRAARGEQFQVGLPPNPTFGYLGGEIGNDGSAGQQGVVFGQEFIRGNKLGLNRVVAAREAERREQEFAAQERRVLTDVRMTFYDAYLAQQRAELSRRLQAIGEQSVAASNALLEAQEGRRTDLLQAEIEGERAGIAAAQAEATLQGAWRRLAALVGQQELPMRPLAADVQLLMWQANWDETLGELLRASPEVAEAQAEVDRARAALARACAEPIPDVTAQASVQYDDSSEDTIAGAQVTLPLPIWNRNQGGIAKAQAELVAARRRLEAVERRLQHDLATQYQRYEASLARVSAIRDGILERAQENLDVTVAGYRAGELSFLDLLTVQRTYFQVNLEYLSALGDLNESVQLLDGLLLSGSYNESDR